MIYMLLIVIMWKLRGDNMRIKVKLSDNDITFTYNDVVNIGEYINVIQIMKKDNKPELFNKSSIEYIRIYIDESVGNND